MDGDLPFVIVVFTMGNTSPSTRHLHVAPNHRLDVSHAVLVRELARDDVTEDLCFSVIVERESLSGLYVVS